MLSVECRGRAREDLLDDAAGVGDLIEADEGIDFGNLADELRRETLRHASTDDEFLPGALFQAARLMRFENGLD